MSDRLALPSAVVTGGGTGIGACVAERLAADGLAVAVLGRRQEPLDRTVDGIVERGGKATSHVADVRDADAVAAAAAEVTAMTGVPSVVVNCAGVPRFGSLLDLDIDDYDDIMATNLRGTVVVSQAFARLMVDVGAPGSIVNVSSEVAARGTASATAYGASKAALNYVTKVWAVELAQHGIRVNAVAPGLTDTEEGVVPQQGMGRDDFLDWMSGRIPAGRAGRPEEVADVVAFLASDRCRYVTGSLVAVDGGISAT